MDPIPMTAEELEAVQQELHRLEGSGRTDIAARIKTAREWGDLKENAEYHAAKEDQAHLETRIARLRQTVRNAEVVQAERVTDVVTHGSTVTFNDRASGREQRFRIVSAHQASPAEGTLSAASPIAQALSGHRVGDVVVVRSPAGERELEITGVA